MRSLICLLAFLYIASYSVEAQRRQLNYEPQKVTLTGKLVYRTFYGPPGYGESPKTDSRETQPILILDSPVDVIASQYDSAERGVKLVTLVVMDFKANPVRPLLGTRVKVEGTLFHAITGHHHTKVLMTVSYIKRAR